MEPFEKIRRFFSSVGNNGYRIVLRRSGYASTNDADRTKFAVENWDKLTPEQIQQLRDEFKIPTYLVEVLVAKRQAKVDQKNVAQTSPNSAMINKMLETIEPVIKEGEVKLAEQMRKQKIHIDKEYKTLSSAEFDQKYGKKIMSSYKQGEFYYEMYNFYNSLLGKLLTSKDITPLIEKAQKAYRDGEVSKVHRLWYNLGKKYPTLNNFVLINAPVIYGDIEFVMTAFDDAGETYTITTNTIVAGGYNIQVAHYRWLMHVKSSKGKVMKITSGK
jgi:hypothetical protein